MKFTENRAARMHYYYITGALLLPLYADGRRYKRYRYFKVFEGDSIYDIDDKCWLEYNYDTGRYVKLKRGSNV